MVHGSNAKMHYRWGVFKGGIRKGNFPMVTGVVLRERHVVGRTMSESVSRLNAIEPKSPWNRFEAAPRRGHGSTAWATNYSLKQPQDQDGASAAREAASRVTDISTRLQLAAFGGATLVEPEDARLTGGTRSLVRRLLGLNITPRAASPVVGTKAVRPAKKVVRLTTRAQVA